MQTFSWKHAQDGGLAAHPPTTNSYVLQLPNTHSFIVLYVWISQSPEEEGLFKEVYAKENNPENVNNLVELLSTL